MIGPIGFQGLPSGWVEKSRLVTVREHERFLNHFESGRSEMRQILLVVHGLGEHGGRYLHFPHHLGASVDAVFAPDHYGHGRSPGLRGDAESFETLAEDFAAWVEWCQESYPSARLHLLAHSLGAQVAMNAFVRDARVSDRFASVSLSAPLLAVKMEVPKVKKIGAHALYKLWPTLQLPTDLDAKLVSRDPHVVRHYVEDRLNHGKMTPRFFVTLMESLKKVKSKLEEGLMLSCPVQSHIAGADGIVSSGAAQELLKGLKAPEVSTYFYPESFHEVFNEPDRAVAFERLGQWIRSHS